MVVDIPVKEDFEAVGVALLNQSWEMATGLLLELDEAKLWADEQDVEQYWKSAGTKMATALSIAHQGAEFLIKARIVHISPYLLIANAPRDWPKANEAGHVSFSKFRTIDAQDLIRLHDSAAEHRLTDEFAVAFEALRIRRNSIMHTVDQHLKIHVTELLQNILQINHSLMAGRDWVQARRDALEQSPSMHLGMDGESIEESIVRELVAVLEALPAKDAKLYFGFDKKRRAYLCPDCSWDHKWGEHECYTALLEPNTPDSDQAFCFLCKAHNPVDRIDCQNEDCKGNVISCEFGRCMTCATIQEHSPEGAT